jgi:hypothetical protein
MTRRSGREKGTVSGTSASHSVIGPCANDLTTALNLSFPFYVIYTYLWSIFAYYPNLGYRKSIFA